MKGNFLQIYLFNTRGFFVIALSFILLVMLLLIEVSKSKFKKYFFNKNSKLIYANIFLIILSLLFFKNFYNVTIEPLISYSQSAIFFSKILKKNQTKYSNNLKVNSTSARKGTYIIVRGESLSYNYTSLGGYHRNTTPNMFKHHTEGSLISFTNFIAPNVHTELAMRLVYSFNKNLSPDILDLLLGAKYEVFAISNTRSGKYNQYSYSIYKRLKDNFYDGFPQTDMALISPLENLLKEKFAVNNKIIFLDTMGNHMGYKSRYINVCPEVFKKENNKKLRGGYFLSDKQISIINDYDNATRCWDIFMESVIDLADKYSVNAVVYFSDHGDTVYEGEDFFGHNSLSPNLAQIKVPFFVYTKDQKIKNLLLNNKNKIWSSKDFVHFLHSFFNINSNLYEEELDILSKKYKNSQSIGTIYNWSTYQPIYEYNMIDNSIKRLN